MSEVCIVSYFYSSSYGVGGVRAEYWYRNLEKLSSGKYRANLILGTQPEATSSRIHFVKPMFEIKFDQGLGWILPLWIFLMKNAQRYDVFIFTCGPFLHLLIVPWLKLFFGKKIIVDYRDPFSNNPVFPNSWLKLRVKKFIELFVNLCADHLVTVNYFCKQLLVAPPSIPVSIIDNGYDESIAEFSMSSETKISFLYPGEFSVGRDPVEFLKAIESSPFQLTHIGKNRFKTDLSRYEFAGRKNYSESLGLIKASECCVLFCSGHPFESTTKIFDFLRFNKRILIVSNEWFSYGALREITAGNPRITWVRNDKVEIEAVLKFFNFDYCEDYIFDSELFSRKQKCLQLIRVLDQI